MKKYSTKKKSNLIIIDTKGYAFTSLDILLTILFIIISVSGICIMHKLNIAYSIFIAVTVICSMPFVITAYFTYKSEKRRFDDYCIYFEYMKMYYKSYNKIINALKETEKQFKEKSEMKECIHEAIYIIEQTGDYRKGLDQIDDKFHNTHLERLHSLLVMGESQGTTGLEENLNLINYESWRENTILHQKQKKVGRMYIYGFALLAMVISVSPVYMLREPMITDKLFIHPSYQMYTFVNLEIVYIIFISIWIYLVNKKWIRSDE